MTRLLVHVEGETEETFVNEVLAPHLYEHGYSKVSSRLLGNARQRSHRGGIKSWEAVAGDIIRHLQEDPGAVATTMVDYYALPSSGEKAWPGRGAAPGLTFAHRAPSVQEAIAVDLAGRLSSSFDRRRFVPFVLMHEFEALLFSDCDCFAKAVGLPTIAASLTAIRQAFATPEEINDDPQTAPSKRVEALIPGYQKPLYGVVAALGIGLPAMRAACPHFSSWLGHLEQLPARFGSE